MLKKLENFTNEEKKIINKIAIICNSKEKLINLMKFIEKKADWIEKTKRTPTKSVSTGR
jgi:hypothetical protein